MDRLLITKKKNTKKPRSRLFIGFIILALVSILDGVFPIFLSNSTDYRLKTTVEDRIWTSRTSGLAPHPKEHVEPVIQVYAARTWGLKGALAVHTWIAIKGQGEAEYVVSQVIGWRQARSGTALFSEEGIPDKSWYGNEPTLLLDLKGKKAGVLINEVKEAIARYPWSHDYTLWPGPNSNTFIAWLGLEVPELGLDLPSTAIGKDWRPFKQFIGPSASGTGLQASLFGLLGASIGYEEGLEINLLGLSMELDLFDLAVELPGYGRIGLAPVSN